MKKLAKKKKISIFSYILLECLLNLFIFAVVVGKKLVTF